MTLVYRLEHVSFRYQQDPVLEDVSFQVESGDYVGIIGENGSGKTTLLRLLIGERKPHTGQLSLFGVTGGSAEGFKKIGYVPQINPADQQAFPIRCDEMVMLGLCTEFGRRFRPTAQQRQQVDDVMHELGIRNLADTNFRTLSGGQKQRVHIAKALVRDPEVLLFDEPTVGIDEQSKAKFFQILDHLNAVHGITIMMVSHETDLGKAHWKRTIKVERHGVVELC